MLERRDGPALRQPLHLAVPAGLEEPPRHARQRADRVPRQALRRPAVVPPRPGPEAHAAHLRLRNVLERRERRQSSDYATAARTPDGKLAIAYLPTVRTVTVDTSKLAAKPVCAVVRPERRNLRSRRPASQSGTTETFRPPDKNHDGDGDWVLVLTAGSR